MRVCILGNSLSGLALAKALVNQNISVDLVYEKKQKKLDQSRTIGISRSNVHFFNNHIIDIKKIIWKLNKIEIYTDNLQKEKLLNFENNGNELFSIIRNIDLVEVLKKSLSNNKKFKKLYKKINSKLIEKYDLVVNTDIFNFITKKYFYNKIVKEYNSSAYTTTIDHKKIKNNVATQIFTKKGPLAFLPISHKQTSIVYSIHNSSCKRYDKIDDLIDHYNFKYEINKIEKISSFNLKSFSLRSYHHNNILAFGDLLHRIHPLAGQGFNMTIRDIKILSNIIQTKFNLGLPLDSSVNKEFENKLRHNNFIFSNGIDLVHEFFNFERKTNNNVVSKAVQFIGKNPSINKVFTKIADKGIIF
tara:strand:+ start:356 stop:1432 length:1077 start_codon:yes stop_codon:yes gene_type:complete